LLSTTHDCINLVIAMTLLHIYDASDWRVRQTAGRRDAVYGLGVRKVNDDLVRGLDALAAGGQRFAQILFETHGSPGVIGFGDESICAGWLRENLKTRHYETLCLPDTKVYFNGCNVAEGDEGWDFLEAAGEVFLRTEGGTVFGQNSLGWGNPFNGHVVHFWGKVRTVYVAKGGFITARAEK